MVRALPASTKKNPLEVVFATWSGSYMMFRWFWSLARGCLLHHARYQQPVYGAAVPL